MTSDVEKRLVYHNSGKNRSTKNKGPWKLIYKEIFDNKKSAWLRERQIKSYKGGSAFKRLVIRGGVAYPPKADLFRREARPASGGAAIAPVLPPPLAGFRQGRKKPDIYACCLKGK